MTCGSVSLLPQCNVDQTQVEAWQQVPTPTRSPVPLEFLKETDMCLI